MAYRGRGRGRGFGGGGGYPSAKQVPFELFPEIELPDVKNVPDESKLIPFAVKLENFWRSSPYYLEDLEQFVDEDKKRMLGKVPLSHFIKMTDEFVPAELAIQAGEKRRRLRKKVRWNPDSDLQRLDLYEKLEQKDESEAEKEKDGEDEEDDDNIEVEDEEFSDDGDYNQNIDFDDDEDEFNMDDDNDDEPTY